MDYRKIAYGSIVDIQGRVWGIDLYRNDTSPMMARELTFDADSPAVVEWDEFDLEQPIQGSSLTLRIISEADREWVSLYTVKDGDVVAEVTLDGALWWRGSLDPETYEEPYEKADGYTVELRFSDFGPLKRHMYVPGNRVGDTDTYGIQYIGPAIGDNLLAIGTVAELGNFGLPANAEMKGWRCQPFAPDEPAVLGISASIAAFFEEGEEGGNDYIKAWDALSGLLGAANARMVQRAGKILIYNLAILRDTAVYAPSDCEWSGDSQTLSADRIASRVIIKHSGDCSENWLPDLETGRELDGAGTNYVIDYHYSNWPDTDNYPSFLFSLFDNGTWKRNAGGRKFFRISPELDSHEAMGWNMYCAEHRTSDWPEWKGLDQADSSFVPAGGVAMTTPETFVHMRSGQESLYGKYSIKLKQEMLFSARYNPFSDSKDSNYDKEEENLKNVHCIYVLCQVKLRSESGKTYYCVKDKDRLISTSTDYIADTTGSWRETPGWYWLQYRPKDGFRKDQGIVNGNWQPNRPAIPYAQYGKDVYDKTTFPNRTTRLPDGDFMSLPPEEGWLSVSVYPVMAYYGRNAAIDRVMKLRWILAKGAEVSLVKNYNTPQSASTEIKVICDNGAEDNVEIDSLIGSGGGFRACPTRVLGGNDVELDRATEIASQLCSRRTMLKGEAMIDTGAALTFHERLQGDRLFLLVSERMDLRLGFGDRTITELLRTDVDGLEVRRNDKVIMAATDDRGGRDDKDTQQFSLVPSATSVSSVVVTEADPETGTKRTMRKYTPAKLRCTAYLTVGSDMTKTRDGVLTARIYDREGIAGEEVALTNEGGESEEVEVPLGCTAIEFALKTDETEQADEIASCLVPVYADYLVIDVDRGAWANGEMYYAGELNEDADIIEQSHVWYFGCKFKNLKTGTTDPPRWDSPDWEFEEGDPDLRLRWNAPDTDVYIEDPHLYLEVATSLYNQDITDSTRVRYDWTRESWRGSNQDTTSDSLWNTAHENTGNSVDMDAADLNWQFGAKPDLVRVTCTATLLNADGTIATNADGTPMSQEYQFEI